MERGAIIVAGPTVVAVVAVMTSLLISLNIHIFLMYKSSEEKRRDVISKDPLS